jgi:hypothetical protein
MKRTTVVLSDELATLIGLESRRRGVPAATVVRDALDDYFSARSAGAPTAGIDRSSETQTARDMEEMLAREWTYERIMGVADSDPIRRS